jgi:uncharacterized damage-inducible protein DinB
MDKRAVLALFDYGYWATWQILATVGQAPPEVFTATIDVTWRNVRDTLVLALDVEQSWRRRLRGEDESVWYAKLPADRFGTPAELEAYWRADADEMTTWLAGLDDVDLAATVDLGPRDRFPLWFFLVHIVTHGIEQRRDVAILMRNAGRDVPELEFLWYADSLNRPGTTG